MVLNLMIEGRLFVLFFVKRLFGRSYCPVHSEDAKESRETGRCRVHSSLVLSCLCTTGNRRCSSGWNPNLMRDAQLLLLHTSFLRDPGNSVQRMASKGDTFATLPRSCPGHCELLACFCPDLCVEESNNAKLACSCVGWSTPAERRRLLQSRMTVQVIMSVQVCISSDVSECRPFASHYFAYNLESPSFASVMRLIH